MSCEDQATGPTDHCTIWGCKNAKLVKRGRFWCCPKCGGSYGENPFEGADSLPAAGTDGGTP
jgi:hypothetical protein